MKMKSKNPAFLFYSNDFYEGTRLMLPEERACFIDLLIYQHQHEFIPNDIQRISMYCSGIANATLIATLNAKFTLCDKGWYNIKLQNVVNERHEFSEKQSINGTVGNFWKKAILIDKQLHKELKVLLENKNTAEVFELIKNKEITKDNLIAMRNAMRTHLEDEDEDIINIINIEFEIFWNMYEKKVGEIGKLKSKWNNLSDAERNLILEYLPKYKSSVPDKKFRKNPETFLNNKSWNDEIINNNNSVLNGDESHLTTQQRLLLRKGL